MQLPHVDENKGSLSSPMWEQRLRSKGTALVTARALPRDKSRKDAGVILWGTGSSKAHAFAPSTSSKTILVFLRGRHVPTHPRRLSA